MSKSNKYCAVPHCKQKGYVNKENGTRVTFHQFPQDQQRKRDWLVKIRRDEGDNFKVGKETTVCSLHFVESDFTRPLNGGQRRRLRDTATPSVFDCWKHIPHVYKPVTERRTIERAAIPCTKSFHPLTDMTEDDNRVADQVLDPEDLHSRITDQTREIERLKIQLSKVTQQVCALQDKNETLQKLNKHLIHENKKLQSEIEKTQFSVDNVKDNDICFYTGFPERKVFVALLEHLNPGQHGKNIILANSDTQSEPGVTGRPRKLSAADQFFMFLVRVRVGLLETDLSYRFGVSQTTVSRLLVSWANFLYLKLGSINIWPTREEVDRNMPESFKLKYPHTRVILDATEIKVQMPSSLVYKSQTYSNYKGTNTLKGLIGISPSGQLSFVSQLYTGSISDREITLRSGFLELPFDKGDGIMADKGFDLRDLLDPIGVSLNIPPFLGPQDQMPDQDVVETQQIASERIHVERLINKIKNFHIFNRVVPLTLSGTINQIWTVCAILTLFQKPIISMEK